MIESVTIAGRVFWLPPEEAARARELIRKAATTRRGMEGLRALAGPKPVSEKPAAERLVRRPKVLRPLPARSHANRHYRKTKTRRRRFHGKR